MGRDAPVRFAADMPPLGFGALEVVEDQHVHMQLSEVKSQRASKRERERGSWEASKQASKGAGRLGMSPLHCSSESNTSYTSYWRVCDGTVFSTNVNR